MTTCARQCWIFAAVMGVLVLALSAAGVGVLAGVFLGLVTTGLLGGLMTILFCEGAADAEDWPEPVDSASDPDMPGARSIREDAAAVAHAAIARPSRPLGMTGAPEGAASDAAKAATFVAGAAGAAAPKAAKSPARPRRNKAAAPALAEKPETAHSGAAGGSESR